MLALILLITCDRYRFDCETLNATGFFFKSVSFSLTYDVSRAPQDNSSQREVVDREIPWFKNALRAVDPKSVIREKVVLLGPPAVKRRERPTKEAVSCLRS